MMSRIPNEQHMAEPSLAARREEWVRARMMSRIPNEQHMALLTSDSWTRHGIHRQALQPCRKE